MNKPKVEAVPFLAAGMVRYEGLEFKPNRIPEEFNNVELGCFEVLVNGRWHKCRGSYISNGRPVIWIEIMEPAHIIDVQRQSDKEMLELLERMENDMPDFKTLIPGYDACVSACRSADSMDWDDAISWLNEAGAGLEYPDIYDNYQKAKNYVDMAARDNGVDLDINEKLR